MRVVSWRRNGNRSGASDVSVAKLVGQALQFVGVEVVVVPQDVIVGRSTCALNTLMTAQVEVEFCRMCDADVDGCTCRNISRLAALFLLVGAEQSRVMALLHDDEGDSRTVISFEFDASFADRRQFVLQNVRELTFGHAVTVENDAMWFVAAGGFVEHDEKFTDHAAEFLDHLLTMLLDANSRCIARRMRVH